MTKVVTASYESREDAEYAAQRLIAAGLMHQEISMLAPEAGGAVTFSIEPHKRTLAGIGGGALFGLLAGALCAALLSLIPVPLVIPALDVALDLTGLPLDFAELGPVLSALIGAGAGAGAGALVGAVVGLSRTEHEAVVQSGDHAADSGTVLLGVAVPPEMMRSAVSVMNTAGALTIQRR